jgi:membrane protease YdiL (CAAX protease family)
MRLSAARHPIAAFLLIGNGVYLAAALTPSLVEASVLPLDLPLFAVVGGILGVGLAAFVVTGAADGWPGVSDLARRSLRWRVPVRWYPIALLGVPVAATLVAIAIYGGEMLEAPPAGWPRALAAFAAFFVLQLILFQLAEEIGWTGFLQHRLHDRFGALKLSAAVALPWAVWHLPDFFAEEGWTLATLAVAPLFLVFEFVSLFFARVLIVWLYDRTGRSVLLVAMFHASFDATISKLSVDIFPGSNAARFAILTGVIVVAATSVIVATRGRVEAPIPEDAVNRSSPRSAGTA